ncbi:MAG: DUF2332 domain-containing protein [Holophagales bacterium]|nr:DUF2332 domain-containing protein [Holophagales bacterium]MYC10712.1 DUF2332 domain-containing protein [Holophagales bacterium]
MAARTSRRLRVVIMCPPGVLLAAVVPSYEAVLVLRAAFEQFARVEAPELDSPTYAELAAGVAGDGELLALAAQRQDGQPAPNMLFGAVQYLLLRGVEHPLAAHYPILSGAEPPPEPAFPLFRAFCLEHREAVGELIVTRRTQTQVVRRCTCLLPVFGQVFREAETPLALIDVGASAGLNLNFDRYAYRYRRAGDEILRWERDVAGVELEADLRGPGTPPPPPPEIPVASRDGIDLNPIDLGDADELLWLRALIWPEHVERHAQLVDAAAELKDSPVRLHRGDASRDLPHLLERVPAEAALVVYSTIALYQIPREGRRRITAALEARSRERPVWQVALEGVHPPSLTLTRYRDGAGEAELLARASPHGWWIEWRNPQARRRRVRRRT